MPKQTKDWREALQEDEPPAWAVEALADEVGSKAELARRINVDPNSVTRWCMDRDSDNARTPTGAAVGAMRLLAEKLERNGGK